MAQATPLLEPPGTPRMPSAPTTAPVRPTGLPPSGAGVPNGEGRDLRAATISMDRATFDAAPSLRPAEDGAGIGAWNTSKKITALWSINQNRNSWIHVDGVGWRKLANNSDSAIMALSILGAHAREKASAVNYRDEADGMIHEIYVW